MFGGQVDGRSDIYSLGLVLVAAAQGEALDMGQSPISVIEARRSVPDLSRVPEAVRADLAAMLQPDPADRPQSMRALVGAAAPQGRRRADSAAGRERPVGGRTRLVPIVGAVAVLALVAGGGWYWYEFVRTTDEASAAGSGQEASATSTSTTTTPGESQTQVTPVVVDQTTTTPLTADAADATQATPAAASTDTATVAADESPPIVDTSSTSTGVSATAPANESSSATTPPDGAQPADTQVALLPQALDIDRLRDDANRVVQGLSCAGIRIDVSDRGEITASGYVGSEADRTNTAEQLGRLADVGRVDNALVVMKHPICDALGVVREETAYGAATAPRIDPGGAGGVYREGENLKLTVTAMADGYLYVDYIDAENDRSYVPADPNEPDRYVLHLLPNANWRNEQRRVTAGEKVVIGTLDQELANYVITEPFGTYVVIAISSPEPLFEAPRTVQEPASLYLQDLRARLAQVAQRVGRENLPATSTTIVFQAR
jgi:hypothetical protein